MIDIPMEALASMTPEHRATIIKKAEVSYKHAGRVLHEMYLVCAQMAARKLYPEAATIIFSTLSGLPVQCLVDRVGGHVGQLLYDADTATVDDNDAIVEVEEYLDNAFAVSSEGYDLAQPITLTLDKRTIGKEPHGSEADPAMVHEQAPHSRQYGVPYGSDSRCGSCGRYLCTDHTSERRECPSWCACQGGSATLRAPGCPSGARARSGGTDESAFLGDPCEPHKVINCSRCPAGAGGTASRHGDETMITPKIMTGMALGVYAHGQNFLPIADCSWPLSEQQEAEIAELRAEFAGATLARKEEIRTRLFQLGTVVYPPGTPEYERYLAELRGVLADWAAGGHGNIDKEKQ